MSTGKWSWLVRLIEDAIEGWWHRSPAGGFFFQVQALFKSAFYSCENGASALPLFPFLFSLFFELAPFFLGIIIIVIIVIVFVDDSPPPGLLMQARYGQALQFCFSYGDKRRLGDRLPIGTHGLPRPVGRQLRRPESSKPRTSEPQCQGRGPHGSKARPFRRYGHQPDL